MAQKVNRRKCEILHLDRNCTWPHIVLWAENLDSGFSEVGACGAGENKESRRLQWSFTSKDVTCVLDRFQNIVAMKLGEVALPVFGALVRSDVERCGQFWPPHVSNPSVGSAKRPVQRHVILQGLENLC